MDVHTPEQRRYNMSRIRGRDTRPELLLRRGLHAAGLRFRLHDRRLPGKPDLVFPRYRAVVLVNGCFWHGHDCALSKMPAVNREFWQVKLAANRQRDQRNLSALRQSGWRVLVVWECAVRGRRRWALDSVIRWAAQFVAGEELFSSLSENSSD